MNALPPAPPPVDQAALFRRLRGRLLVNGLRTTFAQSPLRPAMILFCSVVVCCFVFFVSYGGFYFLKRTNGLPLSGEIVGTLFDVLFLILGVFLVFSTGLVLYSSLFNTAESSFLLARPVRADRIFAYKFQGAIAFSSWAFLLLGGPLLVAYGLVRHSPWYFYALLPAFFLGFVLLPGSLGGLLCLLLVNVVPKRRKQVLALLGLVTAALLGFWLFEIVRAARPTSWNDEAVNTLLDRFAFTRGLFVPSDWVARGIRAASRGDPDRSAYFLALVWANGLMLYLLTTAVSGPLFRRGYNRLATGGTLRRRYGGLWLDRAVAALLPFVRGSTRLLLVKDFRTFRRDPQQWAQILIFTGLMSVYFTNVRRLFPGDIDWSHQNAISLLNLSTVSLLVCTYTGRFVFPLLSLEGRKFWILGLLPLDREQLLWGKFAFSTAMVLGLAQVLVVLSDLMLGMPLAALGLHVLTVAVVSAGLSGLSVGMGALMPNFRETDPSKIAVGFGGTLNLVVGLGFLVAELLLLNLPWHLVHGVGDSARAVPEEGSLLANHGSQLIAAGLVAGLTLGVGAVVVPLRMGSAALRRMEF